MSEENLQNQQNTPKSVDYERLKIALDAWKYAVSVQMHFNDIEMKVRTLYFTIVAAAIGTFGVIQGKRIDIPYLDLSFSLAMLLMFALMPISALFYFIDRHWYHRLLMGAVAQGIAIEKEYSALLPEIQLGSQIKNLSYLPLPKRRWKWLLFFIRDEKFRTKSELHSDQKIEAVYKSVIWGTGIGATLYGLVGGITFQEHPLLYWLIKALQSFCG